ncbi:hypothetical protein AA0Y32_11045 [Georgenia phoenicis]
MGHEGEAVGAQLVQGAGVAVVFGCAGGGVQGEVHGDGVGGGEPGGEQGHAVGQGAGAVDAALLAGGDVALVGGVGVHGDDGLFQVLLDLAQGAAGCFGQDVPLGGEGDLGGQLGQGGDDGLGAGPVDEAALEELTGGLEHPVEGASAGGHLGGGLFGDSEPHGQLLAHDRLTAGVAGGVTRPGGVEGVAFGEDRGGAGGLGGGPGLHALVGGDDLDEGEVVDLGGVDGPQQRGQPLTRLQRCEEVTQRAGLGKQLGQHRPRPGRRLENLTHRDCDLYPLGNGGAGSRRHLR